jgi:acyl-CoA synthetase (AMP-forming)/AMP-acid ligase II
LARPRSHRPRHPQRLALLKGESNCESRAAIHSETNDDATPKHLDAHCLAHIARFKRPKHYHFVSELPKNNYGKVLKGTLREVDGARGAGV